MKRKEKRRMVQETKGERKNKSTQGGGNKRLKEMEENRQ